MSLPYELIDKILILVPVKYLLRCRCVSKEWCSLIDSDEFVKKHFERTVECNPNGSVIICGDPISRDRKLFLTDFECLCDDNNVDVIEMKNISRTRIVGVANGLVCLCKNDMKGFVLCNPSTRKFREIPCEISDCCGFGYDHVNDDYKVVNIPTRVKVEVEIYSLKSDSWKRIQDTEGNFLLLYCWGTFVDGTLYWKAFKFSTDNRYVIFGFDLGLEQFKEFPIPDVDGNFGLGHVGGSLCITVVNSDHIDVWLMNNHGAENPWCKAFSVEQLGIFRTFRLYVEPIAYSNSGKDVLFQVYRTQLFWYDLEKKAVKNVPIHGIPVKFDTYLYTESLFQLTER